MIKDCVSGKIDLIVTKSVSRFARNVLDCIGYLREIKAGDTAALEAERKKLESERDAVGLFAQEALDEYARTGQEEEKSKGLLAEYERLSEAVKKKERAIESVKARQRRINEFVRGLENAGEALWGSLVEKVTVYREGMVFLLTCGKEIRV